ncbi:hypothetical protein PUW25_26400 (plasmid) [Paenibacillus urinalis]|uniref:Uncharacterized protein n=1 Tax=Paenibacillus urinalis TaxID=521520 RepID=A0ABY7XH69_9BACL|nr:hypothetical protein [Paenibacillus urinalis]WDI05104.1 hypothetical protein PUW25_26400 [Paenibacillus urinalis]
MDYFEGSGIWESEVIDLGDNVSKIDRFDAVSGGSGKIGVSVATSKDGIQFGEHVSIDTVQLERYIKVRLALTGFREIVAMANASAPEFDTGEIQRSGSTLELKSSNEDIGLIRRTPVKQLEYSNEEVILYSYRTVNKFLLRSHE